MSQPKTIQLSPIIYLIVQVKLTHGTNCDEGSGEEMGVC